MKSKYTKKEVKGILKLKKEVRDCRESKRAIIRDIRSLNSDLKSGAILRKDYLSDLNKKVRGKTKLEWLDFCDRFIEKSEGIITDYNKDNLNKVYSDARAAIPLVALILYFWGLDCYFPMNILALQQGLP
jgi:hypothetical protein